MTPAEIGIAVFVLIILFILLSKTGGQKNPDERKNDIYDASIPPLINPQQTPSDLRLQSALKGKYNLYKYTRDRLEKSLRESLS